MTTNSAGSKKPRASEAAAGTGCKSRRSKAAPSSESGHAHAGVMHKQACPALLEFFPLLDWSGKIVGQRAGSETRIPATGPRMLLRGRGNCKIIGTVFNDNHSCNIGYCSVIEKIDIAAIRDGIHRPSTPCAKKHIICR